MSQLYSPPVSIPLWPLQPFAFGAPTSSLKQMETRQRIGKLLLVWIHNLSLQSLDPLFLLPRTLASVLLVNLVITTHSGPVCNTTAIVMHNWRAVSSQWTPVKDPFQTSAVVDWTQFPIFIHKLQWPPLWPRDTGQMPRPRSCRRPSPSQGCPCCPPPKTITKQTSSSQLGGTTVETQHHSVCPGCPMTSQVNVQHAAVCRAD